MTVELAKEIAKDVKVFGGRAYFCGGYVRDGLLGLPSKDVDMEVYGVEPYDLQVLLAKHGKVVLAGESFGVFKIEDIDVAVPRKEKSLGRSHTTLAVDSDPYLDMEVACRRRDFTYNAMLQDVLNGDVLDFFNGENDLRFGIVRMVDDRTFMEDPLRMLRAAKFAARFGHIISHKTVDLIKKNKEDVRNLSIERVFGEISDILMRSPKPSYGFSLLDYLGLLEILLPEIWVLDAVEQNPMYHPEGSVLKHTYGCIDYEPIESRMLVEQLARLYHDVGKLYGTRQHEVVSADMVKDMFPRHLTNDAAIINGVVNIVENHMKLYGGEVTKGRVLRLASKADIAQMVRFFRADKFSRGLPPEIEKEEEEHAKKFLSVYDEVQHYVKPLIQGRDILALAPNIKPGPIFKEILDKVYDAQLNDGFSSYEGGMTYLIEVLGNIDEFTEYKEQDDICLN